ncbi:MAG TPA: transposase zinc-binding domain-containing protein [Candidatus Binatus sp.]|nr:transposase zinc-binding domain-containing protein [Candidatus Binatus sp.]
MEGTVLHRVVREHFETFRAEVAARTDTDGLPKFVEREVREFLTCGVLARGLARVRCEGGAFERLVPFSCKRRGFCPSCGGRRMAELAAHLVDAVLPHVPVRQWVLMLPDRATSSAARCSPSTSAPCSASIAAEPVAAASPTDAAAPSP